MRRREGRAGSTGDARDGRMRPVRACSAICYNELSSESEGTLEALDVARMAVEAASEKQATDIALLDVAETCTFADYFVLSNGESDRQINAIAEEIEKALKKEGVRPIHREGTADSGWVLLDYGDVIIHVFAPLERDLYKLEELWSTARTVVRIQ